MTPPSPNCGVVELEYELQKILLVMLDINGAWKLVAEASGIFSHSDILRIENRSASPSWELLAELHNKMCTVGTLCNLLEQCKLFNILALLKDREPVVIRKQPGDGLDCKDVATMYARLGGVLELECDATGLPPPQYIWYNKNTEILTHTSGKLRIKDFKYTDEGEYYCCLRQKFNNETNDIYSTQVNVQILPEPPCIVRQSPTSIDGRVGDEITITCEVFGYPEPEVQWFHENTKLEDETTSTLIIPSLKMCHGGTYRCYVKNTAGEMWSDLTQVVVYEYSDEISDRPISRYKASEKVALLIANEEYKENNLLKSTPNDVIKLANKLSKLNFKVIALKNLALHEMKTAVIKFSELLPEGAYALFYFAGHGFEMQDKYMLPVDAPGPECYQRSDSLCEKQVIRDVLQTKPKLFVILLDMCLRVPDIEENPHIYDERPEIFQYTPNRNLIQGYATTSNLGAYERVSEFNGIYMAHLEKLILYDLPIHKILEKVGYRISQDTPEVAENQMPSHSENIVENFYLNDAVEENEKTKSEYKILNWLPLEQRLVFRNVRTVAVAKCYPSFCFNNVLEIRISNLDVWRVKCYVDCKGLHLDLHREEIDEINYLIVRIHHLQKVQTPLMLNISLHKEETLMDNGILELGLPLITHSDWFKPKMDELSSQ